MTRQEIKDEEAASERWAAIKEAVTPKRAVPKPEVVEAVPQETGNQASHYAELDAAYLLACDHPSEPKVQELFRERYRDYRDRYLLPQGEGGVLKAK